MRRAAWALVAAAVLVWAPPATAQTKPTPSSCAGLTFVDAAGDARYRPHSSVPLDVAEDNVDLRAGFFRYVPDPVTGRNVLTANLVVQDLDEKIATGAMAVHWYMRWKTFGSDRFVAAHLAPEGGVGPMEVSYSYGRFEPRFIAKDGETTGRWFEGPEGVVQIVVPVEEMELEGQTLHKPSGMTSYTNPAALSTFADLGPDSGQDTPSFVVAPCVEPGAPTTPAPAAPVPPSPAAPAPPQAVATMPLEIVVGRLSARGLRRSRAFGVGLRAVEPVTRVSARLLRGRAVVATGRLANLEGGSRLRLRWRGRDVRVGVYTLRLHATRAGGGAVSGTARVRIGR